MSPLKVKSMTQVPFHWIVIRLLLFWSLICQAVDYEDGDNTQCPSSLLLSKQLIKNLKIQPEGAHLSNRCRMYLHLDIEQPRHWPKDESFPPASLVLWYKSITWPRQKQSFFLRWLSDNYLSIFKWNPVLRCTYLQQSSNQSLGYVGKSLSPDSSPGYVPESCNLVGMCQQFPYSALSLLTSLYLKIFSTLRIHLHTHNLDLKINQVFLTSGIRGCKLNQLLSSLTIATSLWISYPSTPQFLLLDRNSNAGLFIKIHILQTYSVLTSFLL